MNDRQKYELNQIIQVDTTSISSDDEKTNEDYFIINTKWLEDWVDYVQLKSNFRPRLIYNEILMEHDNPNGQIYKADLLVKKDYRLVNAIVWKKLSTWYGVSGPTILVASRNVVNFADKNNWKRKISPNQKLQIQLVPHKHSLKSCNRKQFVCDTPGTYREREKVRYCCPEEEEEEEKDINNITWYRGKMKKKYDFDSIIWEKCLTKEEDDGNTSSSKNEGKNSNDTNYIYQIKLRDYECYLKIKLNDSNLESNIVGPCDIQTPFCQDVLITGNPVVGNVLKAQAIYWGGVEGASEYSWIRLVKGKREKFSTKPIDPKIPFNELTDDINDIRCYRITEKDIGAKLKVQISPIRSDGLRGESKTSRACKILEIEVQEKDSNGGGKKK